MISLHFSLLVLVLCVAFAFGWMCSDSHSDNADWLMLAVCVVALVALGALALHITPAAWR